MHTHRIGSSCLAATFRLSSVSLAFVATSFAEAQSSSGPTAQPPYAVSVFAPPPSDLSNPDSITRVGDDIFVVYANATQPDGTGGTSTIVQYDMNGRRDRTYSVVGKADGLKYNPFDRKLWALRNEDANPALTLIDPRTGTKTDYTYAEPTLHGGGYDDVVFFPGATFISASNPNLQTPPSSSISAMEPPTRSQWTIPYFLTPPREQFTLSIQRLTRYTP